MSSQLNFDAIKSIISIRREMHKNLHNLLFEVRDKESRLYRDIANEINRVFSLDSSLYSTGLRICYMVISKPFKDIAESFMAHSNKDFIEKELNVQFAKNLGIGHVSVSPFTFQFITESFNDFKQQVEFILKITISVRQDTMEAWDILCKE
jgi:hypothetical protein